MCKSIAPINKLHELTIKAISLGNYETVTNYSLIQLYFIIIPCS